MRGHADDDDDVLALAASLGMGDEWDDMMMGVVQARLQP